MSRLTLPGEARVIGEWSARYLQTLQDVVALSEALAGATIQNAILSARLGAHGEAAGSAGSDLALVELLAERDDWKAQFELSDVACNGLSAKLTELEAEWESQGARILTLEKTLAARPESCPVCGEGLVDDTTVPAPPIATFAARLKPCGGAGCKKTFPARGARKYCDDCQPPRKGTH